MSDEVTNFIPKVTYLSKKPIKCPVCGNEFYNENLLTGRGRLIAGDITEELHRKYKPSQEYGKIYPLNYSIVVCPDCFYASMGGDFKSVPEEARDVLVRERQERMDLAKKLIGAPVDFSMYRTLESGAAGYVLASLCYDHFNPKSLPVIKQAICTIRAAFCFEDLNDDKPKHYFDYLSAIFYRKALFFYQYALELNQAKEQIMENLNNFGPDLDKNYGYDGITYLIATLTYKYGLKDDPEKRKKDLENSKMLCGKLFGMGRSNVDKPKEILDKSKDFYDQIGKELKEMDA